MQDERLNNILNERDKAIQESNSTYQELISNNKNLYDQQLKGLDTYENTQNGIAQGNYEQALRQINQNKEDAQKRTDIENQKAYNSYQKVINPYGVEQESLGGLGNSGYSETFKLGAYNQYQNRTGRANVALQEAFTQYDNEMAEAKRTYDVTKAQNALTKLQMGLDYAKSYNDTNTSLSLGQLSGKQNLNSDYDNRYMNMINQINTEKQREEQIRQFNEQIRQYNEQMAYQKERDRIADEQWQKQYDLSRQSAYSRSYSSGGSSNNTESLVNGDGNSGTTTYTRKIANPKLSTTKADEFFHKNLVNHKTLSESTLKQIIEGGLNSGSISSADATTILQVYGV